MRAKKAQSIAQAQVSGLKRRTKALQKTVNERYIENSLLTKDPNKSKKKFCKFCWMKHQERLNLDILTFLHKKAIFH